MSSLARFFATALALALALMLSGCAVDTDFPNDAQLTCGNDDNCPEGWRCDKQQHRCLAPDDTATPLDSQAVKSEACTAIYAKAQECGPQIAAVLGDAAPLFQLPQEQFLPTCTGTLLADLTEEQLTELKRNTTLIPLATCDVFVGSICQLVAGHPELTTSCPAQGG